MLLQGPCWQSNPHTGDGPPGGLTLLLRAFSLDLGSAFAEVALLVREPSWLKRTQHIEGVTPAKAQQNQLLVKQLLRDLAENTFEPSTESLKTWGRLSVSLRNATYGIVSPHAAQATRYAFLCAPPALGSSLAELKRKHLRAEMHRTRVCI